MSLYTEYQKAYKNLSARVRRQNKAGFDVKISDLGVKKPSELKGKTIRRSQITKLNKITSEKIAKKAKSYKDASGKILKPKQGIKSIEKTKKEKRSQASKKGWETRRRNKQLRAEKIAEKATSYVDEMDDKISESSYQIPSSYDVEDYDSDDYDYFNDDDEEYFSDEYVPRMSITDAIIERMEESFTGAPSGYQNEVRRALEKLRNNVTDDSEMLELLEKIGMPDARTASYKKRYEDWIAKFSQITGDYYIMEQIQDEESGDDYNIR